jgi:hypothetical protein
MLRGQSISRSSRKRLVSVILEFDELQLASYLVLGAENPIQMDK